MSSWTGIPELKASYRALGATRFWLIMAATLTWIGVGAGLAIALDHPAAFGSSCQRKCLIESYWLSPNLLRDGGVLAYALFAWLWSMPTAIVVALILRLRRRDPLAARIHPQD